MEHLSTFEEKAKIAHSEYKERVCTKKNANYFFIANFLVDLAFETVLR